MCMVKAMFTINILNEIKSTPLAHRQQHRQELLRSVPQLPVIQWHKDETRQLKMGRHSNMLQLSPVISTDNMKFKSKTNSSNVYGEGEGEIK